MIILKGNVLTKSGRNRYTLPVCAGWFGFRRSLLLGRSCSRGRSQRTTGHTISMMPCIRAIPARSSPRRRFRWCGQHPRHLRRPLDIQPLSLLGIPSMPCRKVSMERRQRLARLIYRLAQFTGVTPAPLCTRPSQALAAGSLRLPDPSISIQRSTCWMQ